MIQFPVAKIGKQGTWRQALSLFFVPIFVLLVLRWIFWEPFVIPSESMLPNLMVHDHILVNKHSYGIKWPFLDGWLWLYNPPQRGDIVVFRFPMNRDVFFIKRLIGVPGDTIKFQNGQITVNDQPWSIEPMQEGEEIKGIEQDPDYSLYLESIPGTDKKHIIRRSEISQHLDSEEKTVQVPAGKYFMMGDNRDQSHDSRYWGFVPEGNIVGRAGLIWLSCNETMASAPFLCDILTLRSERLFKKIQ